MLPALVFTLAVQAAAPSTVHYFARTDFTGPGLVCGAAFSFRLEAGETAVQTKSIATVAQIAFSTRQGSFSIYESQYTTTGGRKFKATKEGEIDLKTEGGHSRWIYRDSAPGSTDVYGPAVEGRRPTPAFKRIAFGSPGPTAECLKGSGSDERSELPFF